LASCLAKDDKFTTTRLYYMAQDSFSLPSKIHNQHD